MSVHDVPKILSPFYNSLSFLIAISLYILCAFIHFTSRIKYEGTENLIDNKNYIFCLWHHSLAAYFVVFIKHRGNHIWMNHPSWVMKPIHYWLHLSGVSELALGSSGNSGKQALQKVISFLKTGYSTLITPDGPAGPSHVLKPGVLQMSMESGVPVVPLKIIPSKYFILPTWDKKIVPLPFSSIRVIYEKPILINSENSEIAKILIAEML